MIKVAGALVGIAFYIYSIIDVLRSEKSHTRTLPKYVWLLIVIVLPIIGGVVWFVIQFLTPVRGVLAITLALLLSAILSIIFLGKQRDAMSQSMFGFFRRLNERIDAAAAKEDDLEGQPKTQDNSVNQQDVPGSFEDGDQGGPAGPATN